MMVEGRMHKMERLGVHRFINIFDFPAKNLNLEAITSKFEHETLYFQLPKVKEKPGADT